MARPRTFDTDHALQCVRDAFWSAGVHATSIGDLSAATGLTVGSLYKAFESKGALLARVLDDYLEHGLRWTTELLGSRDAPLDGIEAWLRAVADAASADSPTRGCFAVQCAAELAETDAAVRARLSVHDAALHALVRDRLAAANDGAATWLDPDAFARVLTTLVNGLQLQARKGVSHADAHALVTTTMSLLRPTSAGAIPPLPKRKPRTS